jgi:predicted DsbA family dithiol-disulfide isomerase
MLRRSLRIGLSLAAILLAGWALAGPVSASPAVRLSRLSLAGIPQHGGLLGSPSAPVRMVAFDDPQCPFCELWQAKVLPTLVGRYVRTGKLQILWLGYPFLGPDSGRGVRFILAAGLQNHLWEALDDLLANQRRENSGWITSTLLAGIGSSIPGLDLRRAFTTANSRAVLREVLAERRLAIRIGLRGVPSFLLGLRGGSLRYLSFSAYTPAAFTRPISALLRRTGIAGRAGSR